MNKVQPTEKQKRAAEEVMKQKLTEGQINYGKALTNAGYSSSVAKKPQQVTRSPGYRAYLEKYNLTEETVAGFMSEDMAALAPGERFNYIKLLAQMLGMLEAKVDLNVTRSDEGIDLITKLLTDGVHDREDNGA